MKHLVRHGKVIDTGTGPVSLSPQECVEVVDYLRGRNVAHMRVLDNSLVTYYVHKTNGEWKGLVDRDLMADQAAPSTQRSSDEHVVRSLEARSDLTVKQRVAEFKGQTKRSRATYFKIKKGLGV